MTVRVGERLRDREVERLDGSTVTVGHHARDATIVFAPHEDCDPCRELRKTIDERADVIGWWGARLVTTRDAGLRSVLGLAPGEAAVVVIDRFGEVWERHTSSRDGHDRLPDADDVQESAKYLGTQCPECGVPDRPYTGGWTTP